jgi:hypothetical protein
MKLLENLFVCLLMFLSPGLKAEGFFLEAGTPIAMALEPNKYEIRERFVNLNTALLGEPGTPFELNFFPDQSFSVTIENVEQMGPATIYHCVAAEVPDAHILLSRVDSAFCITFSAPGKPGLQATYAEAYTGLPIHRVVEIDPTLVKFQCGVSPALQEPHADSTIADRTWEGFAAEELVQTSSYTNYTVNIMVLFTMNVSYYYGSNAGAAAAIANAAATLNQALANTEIDSSNTYSVNLVHTAMTSYYESTTDSYHDFYNLRDDTGGLEGTRNLGNYYGADLISLWTDYPSKPDMRSLGSPLTRTTPSDSAKFSIINARQANPAGMVVKAFTHEIGHNLGAQHDWQEIHDLSQYLST